MKNIKKHWILLLVVTTSACSRKSIFKQHLNKGGDLLPVGLISANSSSGTSMLWNDTATIANPQSASVNGSDCYLYGRQANTSLSMRCTDKDLHKGKDRWIASRSTTYKIKGPFIALTGVNKGKVLVMERATGDGLNSVIHIYKVNGDEIVETGTYKPDFTDRISLISGDYSLIEDSIFVSFTICGIEGRCLRYFKISNNKNGTDFIEETYRYEAEKLDGIKYDSNLLFLPKTNRLILSHATNRFQGDEKSFLNIYETAGSEQIIKKILASNIPVSDFAEGAQIVQALVMNNKNSTFALCYSNHLSDRNDNDKEGVYATLFSHSIELPADKINEVKISNDTEHLIAPGSAVHIKEHKLNKAIYVEELNTWFFSYSIRKSIIGKDGAYDRRTFVRAYREGIDGLAPLTDSIEADRDGKEFFERIDDKSDMYYREDGKLVVIRACKTLDAPIGEQDGVCETVFDVEVKKTFTSTTMKLTTTSSTTIPVTTTSTVTDKVTDPTTSKASTSTSTVTEQSTTKTITEAETTAKTITSTTPKPVVTTTKKPTTTTTIPKPVITTTKKPTTTTNKPTPTLEDPTTTSAPVVVQPTFNGALGDDSQQTITDGDNQNSGVDGATIGAAAGAASGAVLVLGGAGIIAAKRRQHGTIKPEMPENGRRPDLADYDIADTNTTTSTIVSYDNPDNSVEYAIPGPAQPIVPLTYFADNKKGQNSEIDRTYLTPVSSSSVSRSLVDKNPKSFTNLAYEGQSEKPSKVYYSELSEGDTAALYSTVQKGTKSKAPIINADLAETELYDMPKGPEEVYSTTEEQQKSGYEYLSPNDLYDVVADGTDDANISNIKLGDKKVGSVKLMTNNDGLYDMPKGPAGSKTRVIEEEFNGFGEEEFGGFSDGYLSVNPDGTIKPATESSATNA